MSFIAAFRAFISPSTSKRRKSACVPCSGIERLEVRDLLSSLQHWTMNTTVDMTNFGGVPHTPLVVSYTIDLSKAPSITREQNYFASQGIKTTGKFSPSDVSVTIAKQTYLIDANAVNVKVVDNAGVFSGADQAHTDFYYFEVSNFGGSFNGHKIQMLEFGFEDANGGTMFNSGVKHPVSSSFWKVVDPDFFGSSIATSNYTKVAWSDSPGSLAFSPMVSIVASDATAKEPTNSTAAPTDTGKFTISRTGPTTSPLVVQVGVSGTATNGTDYASLPKQVTIPAGAVSTTLIVSPKYDTIEEATESAIITLTTAPSGTVIDGSHKSATVKIIIPDIAVTDAVTNLAASLGASNFRKIPIKYVVKDTEEPIEIRFAVYQSSDMTWDASDTRVDADVMTSQTVKRKQGTYTDDSLYLKSNISLKYGQRFLIVKADPDNVIQESDEVNNTMFVIPLIPENQPAAFLTSGTFAMYSNTANEDTVAYGIAGRISRDTADFTNALQDISTTWSTAGGTFKDEEPLPYRGDDRRLNKGLAGPLSTLIAIIKETDKQKRFTMSGLKITEAFDAQMEHRIASLHYEGRSIDFSASGDRAERLAGLTLLAGFHWNVNEKPSTGSQHVHLSHRGDKAKLSITGLVQALKWGNDKNLISDARFTELKARVDKALAVAKDPKLSAAVRATGVKSWLDSFIAAIPDSAPSGFVTTMASSISGLAAQKTHIHLLLKRNAALVRNNASLWT